MTDDGDQKDPMLSLVETLFDRMDAWRHLPNYQLERRADLFFALFLPEVLEKKLGCPIKMLIPEFPVHIRTIFPDKDTDKSYKVDYLAIPEDGSAPILVELKTEGLSRNPKQDAYLRVAADLGLWMLIHGVFEIFRATTAKKKYFHLLRMLADADQMELPVGFEEAVYSGQVQRAGAMLEDSLIKATKDEKCRIVYVQPRADPKPEGDALVLSFEKFIEAMDGQEDPLSLRFKESLGRWAEVQAGEKGGMKPPAGSSCR